MHTIGVVARQTGIAAETLRKWESRYDFPVPERTSAGRRLYAEADVALLQQVARHIAGGLSTRAAIHALQGRPRPAGALVQHRDPVHKALVLLQKHDLLRYEALVAKLLQEHSMEDFVSTFALPLARRVGREWQSGTLPVFAEHAFASHLQTAIAQHLSKMRGSRRRTTPRILLALPAGETHRLALVLLGALLEDAGISTIVLQDPLPAPQLAQAARAYRVRVVAVSCSAAASARLLQGELKALRGALPRRVQLWAGGTGALRLSDDLPGVEVMDSMSVAVQRMQSLEPLAVSRDTRRGLHG